MSLVGGDWGNCSKQRKQPVQRPCGVEAPWLEQRGKRESDLCSSSLCSQKSPLLFVYQLNIHLPDLGMNTRAGPLSVCSSMASSAPYSISGPLPPPQQGVSCSIPSLKCICPCHSLKNSWFFASEHWIPCQLIFLFGNLISFAFPWL